MLSLIHRIIIRFYQSILVITALLTLVAVVLITQLRLDLNLFSLLPAEDPGTRSFFEVTEKIGVQSLLISLVQVPQDMEQEKAQAFVDIFAKNLTQSPLIREVEYKIDPEKQIALTLSLLRYLPLFLDSQGMQRLGDRLSDEQIINQVQENKRLLMTPFGIAAKQLVFSDPLGVRELFTPDLSGSPERQTIRSFQGYYRTKDQRTYLLFVKPVNPPQDLVFSRNLMDEVSRIEKQTLTKASNDLDQRIGAITLSYTGGYPIVLKDEAITKKDIQITLVTSFFGVMILFGLSFRTFKILIYAGIPLIIGLLWTLGFAQIVFHELNILTCIFSCVLIGLGIDFAIHMVNRFYHQDLADQEVSYRLERTFQDTGMGIIIGAITTAAAFYSIAVSDFRGFRELGIMTGTGILICLVTMIFILPSLLVFFSKKKVARNHFVMAGFGLRSVLGALWRVPKVILILITIIFIGLTFSGRNIRFDENLRNFRPVDEKIFDQQDTVTDWLGGSTEEILLVAHGVSETETLETTYRIYTALDELKRSADLIVGIKSVSRFIPSPSQQEKSLTFIRSHPDLFDMERITRSFHEAMEKNGFEPSDRYDDYFKGLAQALSTKDILLPSSIPENELTRFIKMFFYEQVGMYKTVTYISPAKDLWLRKDIRALKNLISDKMAEKGIRQDQYHLTGANFLTGELKALIITNMKSSMTLAVLSIVVILFIFYRSAGFFILSITPLIIGIGSLLGIMALFHLDFNFINLIVLPMIVGIGIDDGVHLTNTFQRSTKEDLMDNLSRTGRAIVLTSLTTLVGFGSIILSHYPGLKSIGYVAVIGISACMFASILVLPPLFQIMRPRTSNPNP
ncbi:MAG: MMPL family transporter [Deltaproteobacteria bacterium]|nr:MMPL family transporter [Deltaproteobacteria bacterium]